MTALIITNDEKEDIIKIVKSLQDSGLLLKGVIETVQNGLKEKNGGFVSIIRCKFIGKSFNRSRSK